MLQTDVEYMNIADDILVSGSIYLCPARKMYIISQPVGTYNSVSVNCEWGILKQVPVR